ncbi:GNAT family N-acetyltransferase [uncultured Photobacterium sp.]|uniref:GNAT family N-acetyltransferase n=1 Tax=uncultured Photobacterium sp. TaxID=173973 RepID=UPI00260F41EC|nr:GNAT family N-acetyltransferase [uncultured Photobacterium sp.]
MINRLKFKSLIFTTTRLEVANIDSYLTSELVESTLLSEIVNLLSSSVVESLPPYFHDINTESDAEVWLMRMLSESHLCVVKHKGCDSIIGFVFLSESDAATAHLGYLLAESHWYQGYGSELLIGLLQCCRDNQWVEKLIGGVDVKNEASKKLLQKVGFVAVEGNNQNVIFYEYNLCEQPHP